MTTPASSIDYRRLARPSREGTSQPGLPLRLLTVDLWRVHGPLVVLLAIVASIPTIRTGWTPGVVLWSDITRAGGETAAMVAVAAAGFAAWTAGRDRRTRHLAELTGPMPAAGWARDLSLLLAALYWPLLAQLLIFGGLMAYGARYATFGGPHFDVWVTVTLMIVACALVGFLVGRAWSHPLAAVAAVGATFGLLVVGPTLETRSSLVALVEPDGWRFESLWFVEGWSMLPEVLGFHLAMAALGLTLWAARWLPRVVSVLAVAGTVASVAFTGSAATEVWQRQHSPFSGPMAGPPVLRSDIELQCRPLDGFEICLHPAFASLRDDVERAVGPEVTMFGGLTGMPTGLHQTPGTEHAITDTGPGMAIGLHGADGVPYVFDALAWSVFPDANGVGDAPVPGRFSAAQLVVLHVLNPENAGSFPVTGDALVTPLDPTRIEAGRDEGWASVPREADVPYDPMSSGTLPPEIGETWFRPMHEAANRFAALSPEAQRAWLEANWDALRAGSLTLDDLP